MPDPRFFEDMGPLTLADLAAVTGAMCDPSAAARQVQAVATLAQAGPQAVTFLSDKRFLSGLGNTRAAACFVRAQDAAGLPSDCAALITPLPQAAYALAAARLHRPRVNTSPTPIARDVKLEAGVLIEPGVVLGPGVHIGRGTRIGANTVVGAGVTIGRDCQIGANVTLSCALIGDRVRIMAGAVIGEPGFGATPGPKGLIDIPQLGRVIVQDGVTIGANSCIDRGAFEDTMIGENTKIDNLVQIAHNVRVGRNCVMAAHTGISGSVVIGDGAQFGGRAGVADHVVIGDGARVGAASGVMKDIPPGETWGGMPARPIRRWMRETAWLAKSATRKERDE